MEDKGLVTTRSNHSFGDTVAKLIATVESKGMTVFATIDHASNAQAIGTPMPPMTLIIFGNPQAGTPLMLDGPTMGLDLPVRVLVWQDQAGSVWMTYNDAAWLARRHQSSPAVDPIVAAIAAGMKLVTAQAGGLSAEP